MLSFRFKIILAALTILSTFLAPFVDSNLFSKNPTEIPFQQNAVVSNENILFSWHQNVELVKEWNWKFGFSKANFGFKVQVYVTGVKLCMSVTVVKKFEKCYTVGYDNSFKVDGGAAYASATVTSFKFAKSPLSVSMSIKFKGCIAIPFLPDPCSSWGPYKLSWKK
jgi:hypothetical protein